ncbi:tyrosine-type recombinase/integrase [Fictibacillus sp. Mic-4]|uniref:tyrosine-type recombinase/integrase n=1 Tax=Fictibacillus sp. Mic-4 TaxID=3132826 RepID=UPI003CEF2229
MQSYLSKTKRKGKRKATETAIRAVNQMTMTEMFDTFMAYKQTEGLSPVTIADYHTHFRWFLEYTEQDLTKEEITPIVFRGYIDYMLNDLGVTPVTVNVRIRTLRHFLRFCYNEGYIDTPVHEKFKPVKTAKDTLESFTQEEVKRMLAVLDDDLYVGFRDRVMIYVMLDTMVRASELLAMKRSNVDLKAGEIRLEGDKTKTKKARTVPISAHTVKLLREYIEETEDFEEETLFLTYDGHKLAPNTWRKRLLEIGEKAGVLNKRVSPHTFRHTGALFYIMNGGDPFSLQKILGHSDMSMVRRYIQMTNNDVKRQHNSFTPLKGIVSKRR